MKLILRVVATLVSMLAVVVAIAAPPSRDQSAKALNTVSAGASSFIENAGQWDSRVQFLARAKGMNLWITSQGPVFDFRRFVQTARSERRSKNPPKGYTKGHVVKMTFVNAQPSAVSGESRQSGSFNYFMGKDPAKWVSGARAFSQVIADRPYDGISIRYSIDKGTPRYDVIVKPGADPSQVGIKIEGADDARVLENGNLELKTSLGTVEERGLTAYQETPNGRTQVPCKMVMEGNTVHFDTGAYDRAKTLVLDPLVASTFLGGEGNQGPGGIALDSENNIYVDGETNSTDFPTTVGAYTSSGNQGVVFVSKLDPTETTLIYSATIGGSSGSYGNAIAVDASGNAFLTGDTSADDYPTTTGAYDTTYNGGANGTNFVTELNPSGTSLVYSTYLGGTGGDIANAIALDSNDDAVIAGQTSSTDFPVTPNAYQSTEKGISNGATNGFVTELNPTGSALVFSTYLGGSGNIEAQGDAVEAIVLDSSNNPVVCGQTASADFPTTSGAYQRTNNETTRFENTGFVSRLNSTGTALLNSTLLGGSGVSGNSFGDGLFALALDSAGNVTVTGSTSSQDFPVTGGAYLTSNPDAGDTGVSAVVSRLDSALSSLVFSTYLGGNAGNDFGSGVALDPAGDSIVVGSTYDASFPTTDDAIESVNQAAPDHNETGFVAELSSDGTTLLYGSFLGGNPGLNGYDGCYSVKLNGANNAVIDGVTYSQNFPTTENAFETVIPFQEVMFVSTLNLSPFASFTVSPNPVVGLVGTTATITLASSVASDTDITLSTPSSSVTIPSDVVIPAGHAGAYFDITTSAVASPTQVPITATLGSDSQTVVLTIVPKNLVSLQIAPAFVVAGATATGTLQTYISAYQGSLTVQVGSNSSAAFPQPNILITHGAKTVTFPIQTVGVNSPTLVTITASYGAEQVQGTFTIEPPTVGNLTTAPSSVIGGTSSTGTVTLTGPAGPSGAVVDLSSNDSNATVAPSVTVQAGETSAQFTINTVAVSSQSQATVTASYNSTSVLSQLTVTPATITSVSVSDSLALGTTSATGTVHLSSAAGPAGDTIKLASNTIRATVPSTVKVPAGQTSATFTINTTTVSSDTVATITATYGYSSQSTTLTVLPAPLSSLTASPTSVQGGTSANITVALAGVAGPYGNVIKFASSSPDLQIPATETVPSGQSSYTFAAPTVPVSSTTLVTITDTFWVYSQKTTILVTTASITSLSFTTNPVVGGQTTTCTVTLAGAAGPSGDVVKLSSNSASATVPTTVTVLAGQTSAQFTIHTVAVSSAKTATITATLGTSTLSKALTISP